MERNPDDVTETALRRLIREAQAGSTEACTALRKKYSPLVQSLLHDFRESCVSEQERKDLDEEAWHAFLSAVSSYDTEQKGVTFGLYARVCLRNGLVSALRRMKTARRISIVPLAEHIRADDGDAAASAERERFLTLCRMVRCSLSEYENRIWWAYVSGTPVSAIAASLGRDEKSVHNAIYRIRRKLRSRLRENGQ